MKLAASRVVPKITKKPMEIGSHYRGEYAGHADTRTGTYWEVHAPVTGDMRLLMLCLTAHLLDDAQARIHERMAVLRTSKPGQKGD